MASVATETLNRAFNADPAAIRQLLRCRVPCNLTLADDPVIVGGPVDGRRFKTTANQQRIIVPVFKHDVTNAVWAESRSSGHPLTGPSADLRPLIEDSFAFTQAIYERALDPQGAPSLLFVYID